MSHLGSVIINKFKGIKAILKFFFCKQTVAISQKKMKIQQNYNIFFAFLKAVPRVIHCECLCLDQTVLLRPNTGRLVA